MNTPSAKADGFSDKLCGNPLAWRLKARSVPKISPMQGDICMRESLNTYTQFVDTLQQQLERQAFRCRLNPTIPSLKFLMASQKAQKQPQTTTQTSENAPWKGVQGNLLNLIRYGEAASPNAAAVLWWPDLREYVAADDKRPRRYYATAPRPRSLRCTAKLPGTLRT